MVQQRVDAPVEEVELFARRRPEAVDEHRRLLPRGIRQVIEQRRDDCLGNPVGGLELGAADAGLAVDTHPDLHLPRRQFERRSPRRRDDARRERHPHRP